MAASTVDARGTLDQAVAELRDLPYSFWLEVVAEATSFARPLPAGDGRLEIDATQPAGSDDIRVTITLKRGWRRAIADGFTITPANHFR